MGWPAFVELCKHASALQQRGHVECSLEGGDESCWLETKSEVGEVITDCLVVEMTSAQLSAVSEVDAHPRPRTTDDTDGLLIATDDVAAPRVPRVIIPAVGHLGTVVCHTPGKTSYKHAFQTTDIPRV